MQTRTSAPRLAGPGSGEFHGPRAAAEAGYRDARERPLGRVWRVPDVAARRSSSAARWAMRSSSVISRQVVVRRAPSRRTCPETSGLAQEHERSRAVPRLAAVDAIVHARAGSQAQSPGRPGLTVSSR
jgi:hypothetical protein